MCVCVCVCEGGEGDVLWYTALYELGPVGRVYEARQYEVWPVDDKVFSGHPYGEEEM